jgi:hypothetical protein
MVRTTLGSVTDITENEKKILEVLLTWNYNLMKAKPFDIASVTGIRPVTVIWSLRELRFKGIVVNTRGSYMIMPKIKEKLTIDLQLIEEPKQIQ